ncbi:alpha/beta fold hydrolase [Paenibacillus antri]|nr:alpha/beta hydrolase [Paenibacillus antri]
MSVHEVELSLDGYRYFARQIDCEKGEQEPILFLSGAFQNMDAWDKFVRYFKDKCAMVLIDLPGVGKSDLLPEEYGLDYLVRGVVQLLDHLRIDRVKILSASYGTPIAYEFAKKRTNRVSRLILAGIMKEIPPDSRDNVIRTVEHLQHGRTEMFADEVINGLMNTDPSIEINRRKLVIKLFRSQLLQLTPDLVEKYIANTRRLLNHPPLRIDNSPDVPALIFTGEHDPFTKPEYCREIADSFRNSAFTTIRQADHIFHLEQFDTVIQLCDRFFFKNALDGLPGCNSMEYRGILGDGGGSFD